MKKIVAISIVLVLLSLCSINLVACNEGITVGYQIPFWSRVQNDRLGRYLTSTEFSFGSMEWVDLNEYMRGRYDYKPVVIIKDDPALVPTLNKLLEIIENHKDSFPEFNLHRIADLQEIARVYTQRGAISAAGKNWRNLLSSSERFEQYSVGDYLDMDIVHETYEVGDYHCLFVSGPEYGLAITPFLDKSAVTFYTMVIKKGGDTVTVLCTNIGFVLDNMYVGKFIESASAEERAELAQYYQALHKEIMTKYINSSQGYEL
jgi:hypothetical protein